MKMQFHHAGRQFFFITIAIERHPKANLTPQEGLSRLVDERSRPALLPYGEIVKALLVAMHRCFPCATISDFVIMPDHVHFLLIVDYSQDPTFSPLWATHRLMDAAEILWALERGTDGGLQPPNPCWVRLLCHCAPEPLRGGIGLGMPFNGYCDEEELPAGMMELHFHVQEILSEERIGYKEAA